MSNFKEVLEPLHKLFESTCLDVFASLDCELEKVEEAKDVLAVPAAFIDAASEDLRLRLLLRGPVSILRETYPIKGRNESIDIQDLEEWISELANRFMGMLKHKLIDYQHYLLLGTPEKHFGFNPKLLIDEGYQTMILKFQSGREVFECSLHTLVLNPGLSFDYREPEGDAFGEGELEMF